MESRRAAAYGVLIVFDVSLLKNPKNKLILIFYLKYLIIILVIAIQWEFLTRRLITTTRYTIYLLVYFFDKTFFQIIK